MTTLDDPQLRPLLDEIRARQLAWISAQLVSPEAEATYRQSLRLGWEAVLNTPVVHLVDPNALADALDRLLDAEVVREAMAPIERSLRGWLLSELQADGSRLDAYVPEAAQGWLEQLVARSAPLRTRITRVVIEHPTTEAVMRDVLHDALTDFSNKVNPFFAEWGLPALLKKVLPLGAGAVLRSMDAVKSEFDKRLEPEIRRFLQGASRQALRKLAGMLTAQEESAPAIALRQAILEAVLSQTVSELSTELGAEGLVLIQGAIDETAAHLLSLDSLRARRRAALATFVEAHASGTVGEVLAHYGITHTPDFDALADATWPVIRSALQSEPVQALVGAWIHRFFDEVTGTAG